MAYIGKEPLAGNFVKLDAITTSATATYALTRSSVAFKPANAESLLVSLNGVTQAPLDAYTVNDTNIVFASALTSSDTIDYILALGEIGAVTTPADSTVDTNKLTTGAVTAAKLATNSVTTIKIADDAVTGAKIENNPTIAGNLTVSGNMVGTLTTVAQPNITSVGTLTGLTVSGATTLSSTTRSVGNFDVNTNKFNVNATSGNTTIAGTLGVTGATTLSSTLRSIGNFDVNTNKFTVNATSGNTATSGDLAVTGAVTIGSDTTTTGRAYIGSSDFSYAMPDSDDLVVGSPATSANRGITIVSGTLGNSTLSFSDANSGDGRRAGQFNYQHQYDEYQWYGRNLNELVRFTSVGNLVPTTGYIKQCNSNASGGTFHNGTNITGYNNGNYNEMNSNVNDYILMLRGYAGTGNKYGLYVTWANEPNNETSNFAQFNSSGGNKCIIYGNGTIRNSTGTYTTFSDERLKSNIVDAKSQWEDIKALKFKNFTKFDNPDLKQLGLIAQDVEKTSPSLVFESPPDTAEIKHKAEFGTLYKEDDERPEGRIVGDVKEVKSNVKNVKDSILYMKSVKALQEAMERIETLEAKVKVLENK